jgi:hypothetical protein
VEWLKEGPEFKPQYHKKEKRKKEKCVSHQQFYHKIMNVLLSQSFTIKNMSSPIQLFSSSSQKWFSLNLIIKKDPRHCWLIHVTLVTQEAKIRFEANPRQIVQETLFREYTTQKRARIVAQAVQCLPSKAEALSSNSSTTKNKCSWV